MSRIKQKIKVEKKRSGIKAKVKPERKRGFNKLPIEEKIGDYTIHYDKAEKDYKYPVYKEGKEVSRFSFSSDARNWINKKIDSMATGGAIESISFEDAKRKLDGYYFISIPYALRNYDKATEAMQNWLKEEEEKTGLKLFNATYTDKWSNYAPNSITVLLSDGQFRVYNVSEEKYDELYQSHPLPENEDDEMKAGGLMATGGNNKRISEGEIIESKSNAVDGFFSADKKTFINISVPKSSPDRKGKVISISGDGKSANVEFSDFVKRIPFDEKKSYGGSMEAGGKTKEDFKIGDKVKYYIGGYKDEDLAHYGTIQSLEGDYPNYDKRFARVSGLGDAVEKDKLIKVEGIAEEMFPEDAKILKNKYKSWWERYDYLGAHLEDAIEEKDEAKIKKLKTEMDELESKMHRYERNYEKGGKTDPKLCVGDIYHLEDDKRYYTIINDKSRGGGSYSYQSDKDGAPKAGAEIISNNSWLGKSPVKVGHIDLEQVTRNIDGECYQYYKSGDKNIDIEMANLDNRWTAFAKNATPAQRAKYDKQEDMNYHFENAKMITEWFDGHMAHGGKISEIPKIKGVEFIGGLQININDIYQVGDLQYKIIDVDRGKIKYITKWSTEKEWDHNRVGTLSIDNWAVKGIFNDKTRIHPIRNKKSKKKK